MSSSITKDVQNNTPLSSSRADANNTMSPQVQTPPSNKISCLPNTNPIYGGLQHEPQLIHAEEVAWGKFPERDRIIAQLYATEKQRVRAEQRAVDLKEKLDVEKEKNEKLRAEIAQARKLSVKLQGDLREKFDAVFGNNELLLDKLDIAKGSCEQLEALARGRSVVDE